MNVEDELEEDEEDGRPALAPVEEGRPAVEVFVVVVPEGGREPVVELEDGREPCEVFVREPTVTSRPMESL
ncbi:MAG: hypothetical protein MR051_02730 [Lentisphaeria bacterium]|nr:hypothetical protein [Lentisphaeria bacterium]